MSRDLVKLAGGVLLGAVMLVVLPACGSTASSAPTQLISPAAAPAANPQPATQPSGNANDELFAKGKLIFEKTAGGVGCAFCHGLDGKGNGPAGVGAPYIRGKTEAQFRAALAGGVPMMSIVTLTDDEITAVVAYLQYLNEQP